VLAPPLDEDLRFGSRAEPFEAEAFVAKRSVEALRDAILPGLARSINTVSIPCATIQDKSALGTNSEAVVAAQEGWRAALPDQARQNLDRVQRADAALDVDRQPRLGELVGHRQGLLAVGAAVEHEI